MMTFSVMTSRSAIQCSNHMYMYDIVSTIISLQALPRPTPVRSGVPGRLFGDVIMIVEYLRSFNALLELDEQFPTSISLGEIHLLFHISDRKLNLSFSTLRTESLMDALSGTDVTGLFGDLVSFLLTTIFQLEMEEEEYDLETDAGEAFEANGEQASLLPYFS